MIADVKPLQSSSPPTSRPHVSAAPVMSEGRVILVGAVLVLIGSVSMALYTPAMPAIVQVFGTTTAMAQLTLTAYFGGFALMQLVCGPLSDGLGRRPVTLAFLGVYLAASVMAMLAPDIQTLIAARLLQGVGAASGVAISRAVVRDLFDGDDSARMMNLMGMFLAIGPAIAPALGGLVLETSGWRALFLLMALLGLAAAGTAAFAMRETGTRDLTRIHPLAIGSAYRALLASPWFVLPSLVTAGLVGALYTLATILPFILMDVIGLSPTAFGAGMLLQAGSYFAGALCVRPLIPRIGICRIVPIGLAITTAAAALLAIPLALVEPTFLTVMGPVALLSVGIAFVMPAMLTASMAPFPQMAGAAAAMTGFLQMGAGLVGSIVAALIGSAILALALVVPALAAVSLGAWLEWRRRFLRRTGS